MHIIHFGAFPPTCYMFKKYHCTGNRRVDSIIIAYDISPIWVTSATVASEKTYGKYRS